MKKLLALVALWSICLFFLPISQTYADGDVNLDAQPGEFVFEIEKMKPGDWATKTVTIENNGVRDFIYQTEAAWKGGSKKLFDEFLLEINSKDEMLYEGKLKNFTSLKGRSLQTSSKEVLTFKIILPEELGNEFQGTGFKVEFIFTVENSFPVAVDSPNAEDGNFLPMTATSQYNFLLLGGVFVLVGLVISMAYRMFRRSNAKK